MRRSPVIILKAVLGVLFVALSAAGVAAQQRASSITDSLAALYVSAQPAKGCIIVDQGSWKALFSAQGRPITAFLYRDILPGVGPHFAARTENATYLIDTGGRIIGTFSGGVNAVDTVARVYKLVGYGEGKRYDESGAEIHLWSQDELGRTSGLSIRSGRLSGMNAVIDTTGRTLVPEMFNGSLSLSAQGIAGIRDDTAYIFDRAGRLRFRHRADDCKMQHHGVVALKVYGLWGFWDSTGRAITPVKWYSPDQSPDPSFIEVDGKLLRYSGEPVSVGGHSISYVTHEPGGWHVVNFNDGTGDEIRDEAFKPVFEAGAYERTQFVGTRFIQLYRDYNDATPKIYDRETRRFTDLVVEDHLAGDAYIVWNPADSLRRIFKDDKLLKNPRFSYVASDMDRGVPSLIVVAKEEGKTGPLFSDRYRGRYREMSKYRDWTSIEGLPREKFGVVDTTMREVVPMQDGQVSALNGQLVFVSGRQGISRLYHRSGKVLGTFGAASASLQGLVVTIADSAGVTLTDTSGRVFYRGRRAPGLLYPDMRPGYQSPPPARDMMPGLLLVEDSATGLFGLHARSGLPLLPPLYHPVQQKVTGMHSLKRDDSVYFVSHSGRLLFGGHGFSGRAYFLLEGYAALVQNSAGKWGLMDATGRAALPFGYDTAGFVQQAYGGTPWYFLGKSGEYFGLDNTGTIRYALRSPKALEYVSAHRHTGTTSADEAAMRDIRKRGPDRLLPASALRGAIRFEYNTAGIWYGADGGLDLPAPGVYNPRMERLGPYRVRLASSIYPGKAAVVDTIAKTVRVIDSAFGEVAAFKPIPRVLLMSDSAVVGLYEEARGVLFYRRGDRYLREEILVDSGAHTALQARQGEPLRIDFGTSIIFKTLAGARGFSSGAGQVMIDAAIDSAVVRQGPVLVRRAGKWGLLQTFPIRYILSPVADSLRVLEARPGGSEWERPVAIYAGGLQGLYMPASRAVLPPRFLSIYNAASLQNGFAVVRTDAGFFLVDKQGRALTQSFDSIAATGTYLSQITGFRDGEELAFSIADDGSIRAGVGPQGGVKRKGISSYHSVLVITQEGDKQGLYDNEHFREVLPAEYDAVNEGGEASFVAWKYKPDKHQGIDSTVVVDGDGTVLMRLKGWHNPKRKEGYWYMGGEGGGPMLDKSLRTIVPAGYTVTEIVSRRLFIVQKGEDGKLGILNESGNWVTPLGLDEIDKDEDGANGYLVGMKRDSSAAPPAEKYSLISPMGVALTKPVYDEIRFTETGILFKRGSVKGYLDERGKEQRRKWPAEEDDE